MTMPMYEDLPQWSHRPVYGRWFDVKPGAYQIQFHEAIKAGFAPVFISHERDRIRTAFDEYWNCILLRVLDTLNTMPLPAHGTWAFESPWEYSDPPPAGWFDDDPELRWL